MGIPIEQEHEYSSPSNRGHVGVKELDLKTSHSKFPPYILWLSLASKVQRVPFQVSNLAKSIHVYG